MTGSHTDFSGSSGVGFAEVAVPGRRPGDLDACASRPTCSPAPGPRAITATPRDPPAPPARGHGPAAHRPRAVDVADVLPPLGAVVRRLWDRAPLDPRPATARSTRSSAAAVGSPATTSCRRGARRRSPARSRTARGPRSTATRRPRGRPPSSAESIPAVSATLSGPTTLSTRDAALVERRPPQPARRSCVITTPTGQHDRRRDPDGPGRLAPREARGPSTVAERALRADPRDDVHVHVPRRCAP